MTVWYFINRNSLIRASPLYGTRDLATESRYSKFDWLMLEEEEVFL